MYMYIYIYIYTHGKKERKREREMNGWMDRQADGQAGSDGRGADTRVGLLLRILDYDM